MEDADLSLTRKRPRLNSGDRARRSMSTDELAISTPHSEAKPHENQNTLLDAQPPSFATSSTDVPTITTPNKVTLNLREQSINGTPQSMEMDEILPQSHDTATGFSPTGSSKKPGSSSPEIISVTSTSPPRSPEIQIAELEEIGNEPMQTVWKPIGKLGNAGKHGGTRFENFPFPELYLEPAHRVTKILDSLRDIGAEQLPILEGLATWIESYLSAVGEDTSVICTDVRQQMSFWQTLPRVFRTMLAQKPLNYLAANLRKTDVRDGAAMLYRLLSGFAGLCARLVLADCSMLSQIGNNLHSVSLDLSQDFLDCLNVFLSEDGTGKGVGFWRTLKESCDLNGWTIKSAMLERFLGQSQDGVSHLTCLTKLLMELSMTAPKAFERLEVPFALINTLIRAFLRMKQRSKSTDDLAIIVCIPGEGFKFFRMAEQLLERFLIKQLPLLSRDLSVFLLNTLSPTLYFLARSDPSLVISVADDISPIPTELSIEERAVALESAWRFKMLRLLIMKGRMELRIQGVGLLREDLVRLYKDYVNVRGGPRPQAPIAQYISDLLLESRLLDYLLGPDSHPQLISRAADIVGFLVVTNRYTNLQTDIIWDSLLTSEDPRVSSAILGVIQGFLHLSSYQIVLYLTEKLESTDVSRFDVDMILYGAQLLDKLRGAVLSQPSCIMDMPPYRLCLRLMREATLIATPLSVREREILAFATGQFSQLLQYGPNAADRRSIYVDCIDDLSRGSVSATGSIAAICRILEKDATEEIAWLTEKMNLSHLLIQDLDRIVAIPAIKDDQIEGSGDHFIIRLDLLHFIIVYKPESIRVPYGEQVWDCMLGIKAPSNRLREYAWCTLVNATKHCTSPNAFLDKCITTYLPKLDPDFLTPGSLMFANAVLDYGARAKLPGVNGTAGETHISQGVELLWHLSLVAPSNTIELMAIEKLVSYYLDTYTTQDQEDAQAKLSESGVVGRCIDQLKIAASTIRSQGTFTNSQLDKARLSFCRSLAVLTIFVQGLHRRPGYVSPKFVHCEPIRGDLLQIKYQVFDGSKNTNIQSLEIGDLNDASELAHRLSAITGFPQTLVFAAGHRLDLLKCGKQSLRDMRLAQTGALLVKQAPEAPRNPNVDASLHPSCLGEIADEILKHFSTLYDFLDMETPLAAQVLQFLRMFPPPVEATKSVWAEGASTDTFSLSNNIYRTLYSIYVLKYSLNDAIRQTDVDRNLVNHGVHILINALTQCQLSESEVCYHESTTVLSGLVDGLLFYLKAGTWQEDANTSVSEPQTLVRILISIIAAATAPGTDDWAISLLCNSFSVLVELCARSSSVWQCTKYHSRFLELLQAMLLNHRDAGVRRGTLNSLRHLRSQMSK